MTINNENEEKDVVVDHHSPLKKKKVLVLGATGNTGKHVVRFLLDQGHFVSVIARSKDKVWEVLPGSSSSSTMTTTPPAAAREEELKQQLTIIEASVLDLTDEELKGYTADVDAVVSCLGHASIYGEPKRLVRDAVMKLTTVMPKTSKFILMASSGVPHPDNDPIRSLSDRMILFLIRHLVPPHADNEEAAAYLYQQRDSIQNWVVVRPTDLIDSDQVSAYEPFATPQDTIFSGEYTATRINVAHFMVDLILNDTTFDKWNHKMPVFYDKKKTKEQDL